VKEEAVGQGEDGGQGNREAGKREDKEGRVRIQDMERWQNKMEVGHCEKLSIILMLTKYATSLNFHVTVKERGGGRRYGDIERKDRE
jgi:hypothetical protein